MKLKAKVKIIVDILMTIGLFFTMGYQFWGDSAHKRVGAVMLFVYIVHNVLNWRWYQALFKGKYRLLRIVHSVINISVLVAMTAVIYSGVLLSRELRLGIEVEGITLARGLHVLGSYWGFIGIALHLGFHLNGLLMKWFKGRAVKLSEKVLAAAVVLYGGWAFIKRDFMGYLLLRNQTLFSGQIDSVFVFYIELAAVLAMLALVAYWVQRRMRK